MTMSAAETIASPTGRPMTVMFPDFLRDLQCWFHRRRNLREARAAFMHVAHLEDRMLDDMGVTREEVLWAASLPLEVNAALALEARAARRRAV